MYDKYIIFLSDRLQKNQPNCFCINGSIGFHIVNKLTDKGITILYRKDIRDIISHGNLSFDDDISPKLNTLYIHLLNGEYYSDNNYYKQKVDRERELLFLLAAKLGVKNINYDTEIYDTTLMQASSSVDAPKIGINATYATTTTSNKGKSGVEEYDNRGAPIYTLSKNISQVEENIKRKFGTLHSKIFSYDFYRNSPKLRSFVYKRFNFKMSNMEYITDIENNLEVSFDVKTTLMDYGIGINFEKQTISREKITYKLQFYNNKELRLKLNEIIRLEEDTFGMIREVYDAEENKEIGIYHVTEYVRRYSRVCKVTYFVLEEVKEGTRINDIGSEENYRDVTYITENYYARLNNWIKKNTEDEFKKECRNFTSSYQIRTWFRDNLMEINEIIPDEDEDDDIENYGILKLKKDNYQKFIENIMLDDNYAGLTSNTKQAKRRSLLLNIQRNQSLPDFKKHYSPKRVMQNERITHSQTMKKTSRPLTPMKIRLRPPTPPKMRPRPVTPIKRIVRISTPPKTRLRPATPIKKIPRFDGYGQTAGAPSSEEDYGVEDHYGETASRPKTPTPDIELTPIVVAGDDISDYSYSVDTEEIENTTT